MDIDGLVREWFYELPKGYADAPYTKTELQILDEVLAKHNISLNEFSRSSDRDEIERFVMRNPKFEDKSPRELDQLIDELEEEWDNVNDDYKNIDDYFEELEKTGGLENLTEVDPLDQAFLDAKPVDDLDEITIEANRIISEAENDGSLDVLYNIANTEDKSNQFAQFMNRLPDGAPKAATIDYLINLSDTDKIRFMKQGWNESSIPENFIISDKFESGIFNIVLLEIC